MSAPSAPIIQEWPTCLETSIKFWWQPPTTGAPLLSYNLSCSAITFSQDISGDQTSYTVTGLTAGTEYSFILTATNAVGTGPAAAFPRVAAGLPPLPPSAATVSSFSSTIATVSWTPTPQAGQAPLRCYLVWALPTTGAASTFHRLQFPELSSLNIDSLSTGTTYQFRVHGFSDPGYSMPGRFTSSITMGGSVQTSSLYVYLDAANAASYGGSGTTWSNLVSGGSAYNFTLVSGPTSSNVVYNGTSNQSISFSGSGQYTRPNTSLGSLAIASSWKETREYWVYWRGTPGCLTMESGSLTPDTSWYDAQAAMSNTSLAYSVWQGGTMTAYVVSGSFTSNAWNHVIWQHDNTTNTLMGYVNGVRTYSNASVGRQVPGANFYPILAAGSATNFGYGSASYWNGAIGIFRWYNSILTSNEILSNFQAESGRFGR